MPDPPIMKRTAAETEPGRDLLKAISKHLFLKGLPAKHLARLAECAMFSHFDSDQVVFQEGDIANRFYLLTSGEVVLETGQTEGDTISIETLGKGDVLGWSWL